MSTARHGRVVDAARTPADRIVEYTGSDGTRRIGLKGDRLVAVEAEPGWDDFPDAAALVNGDRPVEAWRVDLFAERGRLSIEGTIPNADGSTAAAGDCDEVVCHCRQVARSRIAQLVAEGRSVDAISQLTGAGTVCGGCGPLIGEIAGRSTMQPARLVGRERLDSVHSRFTFAVDGPAEPALPGASVVLQVEIDGRRITRSYTLTGADAEAGTREITVRREPNGLFSRWLHDHAADDARFRMSSPIGGKAIDPDEPMTFIAGGVGITPALSRLKAMAAAGRGRLRLHWSARFEEGSALTEEVRELVAAIPGAEAVLRNTLAEGRMTAEDWRRFAPFDGTGTINVCGPVTFMEDAAAAISEAGWPPDRTTLESFVSGPGAPPLKRLETFDHHVEPVVAESFHLRPPVSVVEEARSFLRQFYYEHGAHKVFETRMAEVEAEIAATGSYVHTYDELAYGARLAWRNSARCIGRFFWQMLTVFDARHLETEEEVFRAILAHLRFGTNGGDLRPAITVFRPGEPRLRVLNPQIILYAGHRRPDGSVIGDPKNVELTDLAKALGWEGRGTPFDILPVMIRIGDATPRLFELPPDDVVEVALEHPERAEFAELGLKWFAVPAVSDMALDLGGIQYSAAPSNGFYMGTEIGSFNLADPRRYDLLPAIAARLGIPTGEDNPLWRDQAVVEANRAVLHSFRKAGVRILDHHTLSDYFLRFQAEEHRQNRPVYGHWPWIVPPMSSNLSDIWHDARLKKVILKPNYFYQPRGGWLQSLGEEPRNAAE